MNIFVMGAHPDDPDSGAGGLVAILSEKGHSVSAVSFTRGELTGRMGSIEGNGKLNVEEAIRAFHLLGTEVIFLDYIDGALWPTEEAVGKVRNLIEGNDPALVLTHWPIDTHPDHRAVGAITISAIQRSKVDAAPALYFYEVMSGIQSRCFTAGTYVDVTKKAELKKRACYAHGNCFPDTWYPVHEKMMEFRGLEMGVKYAETFVAYDKGEVSKLELLMNSRDITR